LKQSPFCACMSVRLCSLSASSGFLLCTDVFKPLGTVPPLKRDPSSWPSLHALRTLPPPSPIPPSLSTSLTPHPLSSMPCAVNLLHSMPFFICCRCFTVRCSMGYC
jgi:hypothetical protein